MSLIAEVPVNVSVSTEDAPVLREDNNAVITLTLNRPKQYNALSEAVQTALQTELDAIAADRAAPVISTTLGAQGIDLVSGESVVLADSAADFAQAIVKLLGDRAKCNQLAL